MIVGPAVVLGLWAYAAWANEGYRFGHLIAVLGSLGWLTACASTWLSMGSTSMGEVLAFGGFGGLMICSLLGAWRSLTLLRGRERELPWRMELGSSLGTVLMGTGFFLFLFLSLRNFHLVGL